MADRGDQRPFVLLLLRCQPWKHRLLPLVMLHASRGRELATTSSGRYSCWNYLQSAYPAALIPQSCSVVLPSRCSTPGLERQVQLRRWSLPWQAVTLFDPLLQPLRRGFFRQTVRPLAFSVPSSSLAEIWPSRPLAPAVRSRPCCPSCADRGLAWAFGGQCVLHFRVAAAHCNLLQRQPRPARPPCCLVNLGRLVDGASLLPAPTCLPLPSTTHRSAQCLCSPSRCHYSRRFPPAVLSTRPAIPAGGGGPGLCGGGPAGRGVLPAGVPGGQGRPDERLHPLLCAAGRAAGA